MGNGCRQLLWFVFNAKHFIYDIIDAIVNGDSDSEKLQSTPMPFIQHFWGLRIWNIPCDIYIGCWARQRTENVAQWEHFVGNRERDRGRVIQRGREGERRVDRVFHQWQQSITVTCGQWCRGERGLRGEITAKLTPKAKQSARRARNQIKAACTVWQASKKL